MELGTEFCNWTFWSWKNAPYYLLTITVTSVLTTVFQVNLELAGFPRYSSSTSSRRNPPGISGTDFFLLAGCCVLFVSKHQRNEHWPRPEKITHWHHHFLIYHSTSEGRGIALWRQYTYYSRGTVLFVIGCFYLEFSALVWVVCVTTRYCLAGHTSGEHSLNFLGHSLVSCFAAVLL